jgi:hypothetical protein
MCAAPDRRRRLLPELAIPGTRQNIDWKSLIEDEGSLMLRLNSL